MRILLFCATNLSVMLVLPQALRAFGIAGTPAWLGLFASHPPIDARIEALRETRHAAPMARWS